MSARRPTIRLTRGAERDIEAILIYTRRSWGIGQTTTYRREFANVWHLLRDHPQLGQPWDDLFSGCREIPVEQHVIYYHQPQAAEIEVIRVLHHRQDASTLVSDPHSPDPGSEW
jgi:toxin ParE1/3/4